MFWLPFSEQRLTLMMMRERIYISPSGCMNVMQKFNLWLLIRVPWILRQPCLAGGAAICAVKGQVQV